MNRGSSNRSRRPGRGRVSQEDIDAMAEHGGPPSILFLNEAERLIRERLDSMGVLALRLLTRTKQLQARFLRETVGSLYSDYVAWHKIANKFGKTGEDWRPPRERPQPEPEEGEGGRPRWTAPSSGRWAPRSPNRS